MAKGNVKSNKYWEQKYNEFVNSGLSQSMWCKNNGIPTSTFDYWKSKFSTKVSVSKEAIKTDDSTDVVFVELPLVNDVVVKEENTAPIIININQAKIEVNNSCSDSLMASLIKAINNA